MAYIAIITDTQTGVSREVVERGEWGDDAEYLWGEGNLSCDCNRELLFARAIGDDAPNRACRGDRFEVAVKVDGEVVYDEHDLVR